MLYYERKLKKEGYHFVAGIDEAGRGPLAGPVVAAAVVLLSTRFNNRIDDSKKLTPRERESAYPEIIKNSLFGMGIVNEKIIDNINILQATRAAMGKAIGSLLNKSKILSSERVFLQHRKIYNIFPEPPPDFALAGSKRLGLRKSPEIGNKKLSPKAIFLLVDGNMKLPVSLPYKDIIRGDSKSMSIACASILAKVIRDRIMSVYDRFYPQYGFICHKGYPTLAHRKQLEKIGPCPIHRLSFLKNFL
ncbi:MAG: ribonuclease HII [Candidatus Omnitrophota bacterium]